MLGNVHEGLVSVVTFCIRTKICMPLCNGGDSVSLYVCVQLSGLLSPLRRETEAPQTEEHSSGSDGGDRQ